MSKWEEKNLGDFASFQYGKMPDKSKIVEKGYPIYSGYRIVGDYTEYMFEKPQLLVIARGVGGTGDVKISPQFSYITNLAIVITPNPEIANMRYLYYQFMCNNLRYLDTGAAQSQITIDNLRHHKTILPPITTQKRIVDILSAYDDLIENNNKRIALLEKAAEELYKEWFVRFRFPGHENTMFVNVLPEGWEILKVSKIATLKAGGDRPVVFSNDPTEQCPIPVFSNGLDNDGLYGYTDKAIIEKESVTISARGTVGFVCLRRKPYVPIVRLVSIVPKDQFVTPLYLYYYLQRDSVIANGTSQQQITVPMVSRKRIIIPPNSLLQEFDKREYSMWNLIEKLKEQNQNLIKQRDLLLPRLMSGKLEV